MMEDLALVLVIIIWANDLWQMYLFKRQLSLANESAEIPKTFQGYYNPAAYMRIREHFQQALSTFIFTAGIELFIKTMALSTPYHSTLWSITADLSRGARPPAFAALHTIVTRMCLVPFVMLAAFAKPSSDHTPSPVVILIVSVVHIASAALQTAIFLYAIMTLIESFGVEILMYIALASPIIGIILITLTIAVLEPLDMQKLDVLEVSGLLENLAIRVGFNPSKIFVDSKASEPNASYAGILGFSRIIITQALASALNAGQVCAVVAHELGHWAYGLSTLEVLTYLVLLSLGFLFSSYGMSYDSALGIFSLPADKDRPHVSVPVYLGLCYIWPVILNFLGGLHSCLGRHNEFKADEYAARLGYSNDLKTSLLSLYVRTGQYPVQDKWFSAWYHAHPSLIERIQRIDNKNFNDSSYVIR